MRKPFFLKLIIACTFLRPLTMYILDAHTPPLALIVATALFVPLSIALHNLSNKARITLLWLSYAGIALGLLSLFAPTEAIRSNGMFAIAENAIAAWYLRRETIRFLFDPDAYNPWPARKHLDP